MTERHTIDWEGVEREYRAGQLSVSELSRQFSVSRPAIDKRAAKFGWTRNLADEVRREIEGRLVLDAVATEVAPCNTREIIDNAAARGVEVVRQHRASLARLNKIADGIMTALEVRLTSDPKSEEYAYSFNVLGERESIADAMEKVGRTIVKVVPLERQAFNLDKPQASTTVDVVNAPAVAIFRLPDNGRN